MLPDRVSNPGPLTYESGALAIALRGPADVALMQQMNICANAHKSTCGPGRTRRCSVVSPLLCMGYLESSKRLI